MDSLEIREWIENYLLIWNLEYNITDFYKIQGNEIIIKRKIAGLGDNLHHIFYFNNGTISINAYSRWITSSLVNKEKLKCRNIKRNLDGYVFTYDVKDSVELQSVVSRFTEYFEAAIMK